MEEIEKALQRTANRGLVDYFTVPILVLSFLGVWVLLLFVRARVRSGAEPDASAQRPALLGALFGTVPAFPWVYDKLFRASVPPSSEAEAPEPLFGSEPAPAAPEPPLRARRARSRTSTPTMPTTPRPRCRERGLAP